jgi:flavin-dependent dehydrogenase
LEAGLGGGVFDLAIIGAGPAGCAAAIIAARSGTRVLLLERGRFPRHKVCGEFVSAESLELLANLLTDNYTKLAVQAPRIPHARAFIDGKVITAEIDPAAASIARFDLDSALWDACSATGVDCQSAMPVRAVDGVGPFQIVTQDAIFEAAAVINASGRWSNLTSPELRSRVGAVKWLGIKAHFAEIATPASVDLYFFDGGYCGVQPVAHNPGSATTINVCAMVRADVARTVEHVFAQHHSLAERCQAWQRITEPVTTSALGFDKPQPVKDGMLQAGDAAAFVDPFIGDGISLALRSGALAAECLAPFLKKKCSLDDAAARYCREYEVRFGSVFRTSSRLRSLLRWPKVVRKPILAVLASAPSLSNQIVRMTR